MSDMDWKHYLDPKDLKALERLNQKRQKARDEYRRELRLLNSRGRMRMKRALEK